MKPVEFKIEKSEHNPNKTIASFSFNLQNGYYKEPEEKLIIPILVKIPINLENMHRSVKRGYSDGNDYVSQGLNSMMWVEATSSVINKISAYLEKKGLLEDFRDNASDFMIGVKK